MMKKAKSNSNGPFRGYFLQKFERMQLPNEGIDRVMHFLASDGHVSLVISDLLFDAEGEPYVVLDWAGHLSTDDPLVLKRLDPALLEAFEDGAAEYLYRGQIERPQPRLQKPRATPANRRGSGSPAS
jgi:hypothetical protein